MSHQPHFATALRATSVAALALVTACAPVTSQRVTPVTGYDLVIANGRIVDGTGNPWFYGDIAIRGDRIARVASRGGLSGVPSRHFVDAAGMVVAPGFIDIQSHSWNQLLTGDGRVISKVTQGVTTEILGESTTPAPSNELTAANAGIDLNDTTQRARLQRSFAGARGFDTWLRALEAHGNSVNVGSYLGASTVRAYVKGQAQGAPNAVELDTMRALVREAMKDGAFGIATALIYQPGSYATTQELAEMARAMSPYQGSYITHIRSEGDQLLEALDEAFAIGRHGDVPVVVYHLKASGRVNWPKAALAVAKIDSARRAGQDVTATMYPYSASGNSLSACLPDWVPAEGRFFDNLRDSTLRARIVREMLSGEESDGCASDGPEAMMVVGFRTDSLRKYEGLRLNQIADSLGRDWANALIDLVLAENNRLSKLNFRMADENVAMQLAQPWVVIGSDAGGQNPDSARSLTHPRAYGTFTRILGKYTRDEGVLRLEDAVRKMTSATAQILRLNDRGLLREGMFADIVVFDPATIADRATYVQPHQLSVGVRHVWVNGVQVLQDGTHTGATPGRAVRGPGWRAQD
ncbi:MAG TPA: D-aminoacylase [Gemmatimonadaceae bacterium]